MCGASRNGRFSQSGTEGSNPPSSSGESATNKGRYRIEGPAFIYSDEDTGRVATIVGYPTDKLTQAG
jgi:hypothetical protein